MVTFATPTLTTPTTHFDDVRLPNGIRLHYAHQGPRTGPALVLLHGLSDSWFSFSRVLPLFRPDLRIVAPDMRGHGDSSKPPVAEPGTGHPSTGYRIAEMADDVLQMMQALRIPGAVVLGHSMGSFVARRVAAAAGLGVSKLILVGAGPTLRTPVGYELKSLVDGLTDPVDPQFVREFQESTVLQPVGPAFMEAVVANSRRMPAAIWKAVLNGLIDETPPVGLRCRTLVLGGRQDAVFSAIEQIELARQFPRGELELVDGIGHTLHWEDPARFVSALARFGV